MSPAQITVRPLPGNSPYPPIVVPPQTGAPGGQAADPFGDDPTAPPGSAPLASSSNFDPFGDDPVTPPEEKAPAREVSKGEAFGKGAMNAVSFGTAPALAGLAEAAGPEYKTPVDASGAPTEMPNPAAPIVGAAKLLKNYLSEHPDPAVQDAYTRGREAALADQNLAEDQHKWAYLGGQLAGALALPVGGGLRGAGLLERAAQGVATGAAVGGAAGAGGAVSEGQSPANIAKSAATGAAVGGATGGALNAAIGPRVAPFMPTAGERAAQTAENIGAPLPRGVASDSRALRSTTAAAASVPFTGARIRNAVDATREAAGNVVGQSGVDQAIQANRQRIDGLYNDVRSRINPDQVAPMPRTAAAVQRVMATRQAARNPNPAQGLEQFQQIGQQGASFNGAHRARVDAREAGDVMNPHPGYNAADFNQITRAMTADIRANLGPQTLPAFDRAERGFGPISEANRFLSRIARQRGPGAGLDELGFNPATGEFSLDKFVTSWNKLNPQARPFVPTPAQRANIEDIFQMGTHIKSSMRERNTSHTSTPLIMWDLARDAIMTGAAVGAGAVSGASVLGSGAMALPAILFMRWLSSPSNSAAMAAFARAYRVVTLGQPTPARIAAFKIATRNLGHTLDIPEKMITDAVQRSLSSQASPQDQQQQ